MAILGQSMTLPSQSPPAPSSKATWLINRAKLTGRCTPTLLPTESELFADDKFLLSISNSVEEADSYGECLADMRAQVRALWRKYSFYILISLLQASNVHSIVSPLLPFLKHRSLSEKNNFRCEGIPDCTKGSYVCVIFLFLPCESCVCGNDE